MIVIAVTDVFFAAKITETAAQLSKEVLCIDTAAQLHQAMMQKPSVIIADLEEFPLPALKTAKSRAPDTLVIGFLSHMRKDLQEQAEHFCDAVISRSEFTKKLPELLEKAG